MRTRTETILNMISHLAARGIALPLFAFIVSFSLNRLGQERYAVMSLFLTVLSYLPLLDAGLGYAVMYRYSRYISRGMPARGTALIRENILLFLVLGSLGALFLLVFMPFALHTDNPALAHEIRWFSIAASLGIAPFMASQVFKAVLTARNKTYLRRFSDMIYDLLRFCAIYIAVVRFDSLILMGVFLSVSYCLRIVLDIFLVLRYESSAMLIPRISKRSLRVNFALGMPAMLTVVLQVLFGIIDKTYITRTISLESLAYYSIGYDVTSKAWFLLWLVTGTFLPLLMRFHHQKDARKQLLLKITFASPFIVTLLFYVPLNIFHHQIIGWWLGADAAENTRLYILLFSVSSFFYFMANVYNNVLMASGKAKLIGRGYIFGLIFYLPALVLLGSRYGTYGVAASHSVLWVMIWLFFFVKARKIIFSVPKKAVEEEAL